MRNPRWAPIAALAIAGCVAPSKPPPPPRHAPPPAKPAEVVPPTPAQSDWRDVPLSPGTWWYTREPTGSVARYGGAGAAVFLMRCDAVHHEIILSRPDAPTAGLTIRTSYGERAFPPHTAQGGAIGVVLAARDPVLDQIAFSRGRFSIAAASVASLYLPAWAEPGRVIEDCR